MFGSPLDAALHYAAIGWHVFPCKPDKKPWTEHGFKNSTTDKAQIESWWVRWPDAHVGVATGLSGLCVIDLDLKPAEKKDGVAAFERLVGEHGPHGCGLIASTPRGGRHYVYLAPEQPVTTCSDVLPGSGIDVRATGGYVVVPSPASPTREWVVGDPFRVGEGGVVDISPMPPWVLDLVTARRARRSSSAGGQSARAMPLEERQVAAIRRALVHVDNLPRDTWIRVGMALKSTGAREQAYDLWVEWSRRDPGGVKFDAEDQRYQWDRLAELRWDGSEVTIATLFHLAKEGGYVPPIEDELAVESVPAVAAPPARIEKRPFPAHLLDCPGMVGRMAAWMIATSPKPQPALCLGSTLVALGALLGQRVCLDNLRTNLYALGIGPTGCGKEPTVSRPPTLFAHALLNQFVGPGSWKSGSGLRAALAEHNAHFCMVDEFTKLLQSLSGPQVPPHMQEIKSLLMEMFSRANSVHLSAAYADRKTHEPEPIIEPNLCVYGTGVPNDLFASVDRGSVSDGFLNRWLIFLVDEEFPARQEVGHDLSPPVDLVDALRALEQRTRPEGKLQGKGVGTGCRPLRITPEARALARQIEDDQNRKVAELRSNEDRVSELWMRQAEHVQKVALVRVGCDDEERSIELRDVEWAHELVSWCLERTQDMAESHIADSRTEAQTKRVRRIVAAAGRAGLSASALTRATQWLRRGDRKETLQTLVESGEVAAQERKTKGRTTTVYVDTRYLPSLLSNDQFERSSDASGQAVGA